MSEEIEPGGNLEAHAERSLEGLRSRLLDLKRSNPLLNLRLEGKSLVRAIDEVPEALLKGLLEEEAFTFLPVTPLEGADGEPGTPEEAEDEGRTQASAADAARAMGLDPSFDLPVLSAAPPKKHSDDNIQTLLFPEELESRLEKLRRKTTTFLQELGVPTLYAAFGCLEWYESDSSDKANFAPLVLLPVDIERRLKSAQYVYVIRCGANAEPQINTTLREKLRRDFSLALPDALGGEDDLGAYFSAVATAVRTQKRWRVRRFVTLCTLRFERMVMWEDLGASDGTWRPTAHPVLKRLMGASAGEPAAPAETPNLDTPAEDRRSPLLVTDADSSQTMAVIDALDGHNLVVRGPPGTGKSQTITNMISAAIAERKTVVFVAEKMAALQVVRKRLEEAGLGEFALELHSTVTGKRSVMDQVQRRLALDGDAPAPAWVERLAEARRARDSLNEYLRALHSPFGETGLTLHDILWRHERLRHSLGDSFAAFANLRATGARALSKRQLQLETDSLSALVRCHQDVRAAAGAAEAPWAGLVERTDIQFADEAAFVVQVQEWRSALETLRLDVSRLAVSGELSLEDVTRPVVAARALRLPEELRAVIDALSPPAVRESARPVLAALQQMAAAKEYLGRISQQPVATAGARSALRGLMDVTLGLRLPTTTSVGALRGGLQAAEAFSRSLEAANARLARVSELLGWEKGDFNRAAVLSACRISQLAGAVDRRVLLARNPQAVAEKDPELLRALKSSVDAVRQRIQGHEVSLASWRDADVHQLRDAAVVLRTSGWWARVFGAPYRAARGWLLRLTKGQVTKRHALADCADEVAQTLEEMRRLDRDGRLQLVTSAQLGWETADFELLVALDDWAAEVRKATLGLDVQQRRIREALFSAPTDVLDAARQELDAVTMAGLDAWLKLPSEGTVMEAARSFAELAHSGLELLGTIEATGLRRDILIQELGHALKLLDAADGGRVTLGQQSTFLQAFGPLWQTVAATPSLLERSLQWIDAALAHRDEGGLHPMVDSWIAWADEMTANAEVTATSQQREEETRQRAGAAGVAVGRLLERTKRRVDELVRLVGRAAGAPAQLRAWLQFLRAREPVASSPRLAPLVSVVESAGSACVPDFYQWLVFRELTHEAARDFPALQQESWAGESLSALRSRFARLDTEVLELQQEVVRRRLLQREPPQGNASGLKSSWTQMALLKNEVGKQKRHIPIRELVSRSSGALQALFPCFMMSPLSVAQFLSRTQDMFDVLIVDEASQMRPEDAAGAVLRAKQLVVVGDERQLPPTSFFNAVVDSDDDGAAESEYVESILDWGQTAFSHARELLWHYRSRHESLISFSNDRFYGGRLQVFPSPRPGQGVQLVEVEGLYSASRNAKEARIVADAALGFMRANPETSLGVVAMNQPQAELIQTLVDEAIAKAGSDAYRERWASTLTPFFVKNLESVQGDERDVMFISMTYGPSPEGRVFQRFGPINGQDGHRRLNVLFTRARECVRVFSSMRPNDILVEGKSGQGVRVLRDYLEFAKTGVLQTAGGGESGGGFDSVFEEVVSGFLESLGFTCTSQVGVKGFFIDLGLRHQSYADGFVCGVECDGAAYHSTKSARDRDRLRQTVLERIGWTIIRVWSTDWFRDPLKARRKLEKAVREALVERLRAPAKTVAQPESAPVVAQRIAALNLGLESSAHRPVREAAAPEQAPPRAAPAASDVVKQEVVSPPPAPAVPRGEAGSKVPVRVADPLIEALLRNVPPAMKTCARCQRPMQILFEARPSLICPACRERVAPPFETLRKAVEELRVVCDPSPRPGCNGVLHVVKEPFRFPGCSNHPVCTTKHSWEEVRQRLKEQGR